MRLAYVTNNASRTPSAIAAQLAGMGVPATATDIVTSAQAAAHLLADRFPAGSPVLVVGGMGLRLAVRDRGLRPVTTAADAPVAVVQGYAPDISYGLLAEAALALRAGAFYVASNADPTLPTPRGLQPGNGSLVQVLVTATGRSRWSPASRSRRCTPRRCQRVGARQPAGGRRPAGHRHRRGGPRRRRQPAGADRGDPARRRGAGPARHRPTYLAADLAGLNVEPSGRVDRGGGVPLRRLDGVGGWRRTLACRFAAPGTRWTGCARCAPPPGRPATDEPDGETLRAARRRAAEVVLQGIGLAR